MITSHHPEFAVVSYPLEGVGWWQMGTPFIYMNVFDTRNNFTTQYDSFRLAKMRNAFQTIYNSYGLESGEEYFQQHEPTLCKLYVFTHDMEWQTMARLHGVDEFLLSNLCKVKHRVTPLISDWKQEKA